MGSEVRGLSMKRTEARPRPEGLSSTNMGSEVRGLSMKEAEARTRPEGLSSTTMGFEVRCQPEEDGGKNKAGGLILNQYGVPGAWSQHEGS